MTKIAEALKLVFKKHRIVFWYDSKKEFDETKTLHARHIVTDHGWKILLWGV
jgi:hypothetical protein